jgi:CBS domain-containing protein
MAALQLLAMTIADLRDVVRHIPPLAPDDSAARAVRIMRKHGVPAVLVAEGNRLVGMVTEAEVGALAAAALEANAALRGTPLAEIMQAVPLVAVEDQEVAAVAGALAARPAPAIPVAATDGRYLGLLLPRDVLAAMAGEPVVPPIAGLATPLGVYLTTGALRAGAGDLALAATGAALMILNLASAAIVAGLARLLAQALPAPAVPAAPSGSVAVAGIVAVYAVQVIIFLVLLRVSPLTGTHAAEHMVVRAMEEGEDLVAEKVRRLPRVHPRCGTNLMALVVLVVAGYQLLSSVRSISPEAHAFALVVLVMLVALSWRRLGAGLQRWITTKRPSDRQVARAIAAGEELLAKLAARPSASAGPLRRIWHTGFVQVAAGFFAVALAVEYGALLASSLWQLIS